MTFRTARRTIIVGTAIAATCLVAATNVSAAGVDRNRDRIPDRWERTHRLSLRVKQTFRNQDADELFNLFEYVAGTNPRRADSDGDGFRDGLENPDADGLANGEEQYLKLNPRSADSDGDGVDDGDDDADGDGVSNHDEFVAATDPLSACDGDEDLEDALDEELVKGIHFRNVASWFPVADYFDGAADTDCEDAGEAADEAIDADDAAPTPTPEA